MKNIIFLFMFVSFSAQAIELTKSIPGRYDARPRTPEQQESIIKLINLYKTAGEYKKGMLGFVEYSPAIWYSLDRDLKIQGGNVSTTQYLGHWPLSPLPPATLFPITDQESNYYTEHMRYNAPILNYSDWSGLGCLLNHPLRYGDVNDDQQPEIVIIAGQGSHPREQSHEGEWVELNIFSLTNHQHVFRTVIYRNNAFNEPLGQSNPERPQYARLSSYYSHVINYEPGLKDIAKLYTGDFDEHGQPDILIWRKLYESRLVSDPVAGYRMVEQRFGHYELIDGSYQEQATEAATIQTWLSEKNLTWQKGYPSQSECPGREGQLIPEMHDPLLNDADVLK